MTSTQTQPQRRIVLTGGTGAIGGAIAIGLAQAGAEVVLVARDEHRGRRTAAAVERATGRLPTVARCDVACREDVYALAGALDGPIHGLINNAAECPRTRLETAAGIERQFATNVLGYFWMTCAFTAHLEKGAPSRVVNVASYWAGGLNLGDLEFKRRRYDNDTAYRQSKQADRMLAAGFAKRLANIGITVNACHPGDVRSRLSGSLGFGGHETPEEGAATPLMLALEGIGAEVTGRYFAHRHEETCRFSRDIESVEALLEICAAYR